MQAIALAEFGEDAAARKGKENLPAGVSPRKKPAVVVVVHTESKPIVRTRFSERCKALTPADVTKQLTQEMNAESGNILQLWYKYIELIKAAPKRLTRALQEDHTRILNETFGYFAFRNEHQKDHKYLTHYVNYAEQHKTQAETLRSGHFFSTLQALPVNCRTH